MPFPWDQNFGDWWNSTGSTIIPDPYLGGIITDEWGRTGSNQSVYDLIVSLAPDAFALATDLLQGPPGGNSIPTPGIPGVPVIVPDPGGQPVYIPNVATVKVRGGKCHKIMGTDASGRNVSYWVNAEGVPCRRRRMNPLNPKALARSMRRMAGFRNFAAQYDKLINKKLKPIRPVRHGRTRYPHASGCGCGCGS